MFKYNIVLIISYIAYTQAFSCEWPCPLNAECTGQDKCTCKKGYRTIISEEDGLPHCELESRSYAEATSMREIQTVKNLLSPSKLMLTTESLVFSTKLYDDFDSDLVDDNGELRGNYRYKRDLAKSPTREVTTLRPNVSEEKLVFGQAAANL
ncbi:hypothetical protein FF38_00049 [Lucilia cuprina]|uniref:EGF-like domain-containing protein n=1 Tax=Lucilia cuprina TaxID=7375 RepID=A0A0L0BPN2_LUCCU|nr:hypothetical protein FF38_00049 [Lucilia cuprina]